MDKQFRPASPPQSVLNPTAASLDPADWPAFRAQAHRMLDDMLTDLETLRDRPVWQPIPAQVRARFQQPLPAEPSALSDVHQEFLQSILPYTARNAHPGFLGWVQGGGTPVGMLAEMLAAGLNANLGGRDQIPLEVERQITLWMRSLFGFPDSASGVFTAGTSMANLLAVVIARDHALGPQVRQTGIEAAQPRLTAYASTAVHASVPRALDVAGLGSDAPRLIPTDAAHRIDLAALEDAIAADRAAGLTPFLVVGSAGTVDTGAIDDLSALAELCARENVWFHVDGACGALAILAPELAPRLRGLERADSLAFDFHKWAQVPYDSGFLLVRDGDLHRQAFASSCSYLQRDPRGLSAGSPWPCDLGIDLSRGFRALKTWTTLKVFGTDALAAVVRQTCQLARHLEARIQASPELELLAPVELNIVCFRFVPSGPLESAESLDNLNHQIVLDLQEAGAVVPSTTRLAERLAIRAAIVNHRTTQAEIDTLVEATLAAGRARRPAPRTPPAEAASPRWLERDARVRQLDARLTPEPALPVATEVLLRLERGSLLVELGRPLEARADYLRILELDPANLANLLALGKLLTNTGHNRAAQTVFAEAVKHHPGEVVCHVNLGSALLVQGGNPSEARLHYENALRLDPELPQAHGGMFYALTQLGEFEAAKVHQSKAFGRKNFFHTPYRGAGQPAQILLLLSSTGGNTPIEKLLDDRIFETFVVVADFFDRQTPLPPHSLIINGIGDPDVASDALHAARSLVALSSAPVLNPPAAVLASSRCCNAARLAAIPGVIAPATASFLYSALAAHGAAETLASAGFTFPLLLRAPGFHMGQHFVRVESPQDLHAAVAELPGSGRPEAELLAIQFLDARGPDGCARKYRVMIVGGRLYPLHLAISPNWKIHYFSADMADRPDHRAEERLFLTDMPAALGPKAVAALERLQQELGLDYGGIDFGLSPQGDILLFEANATMVVEQPSEDQRWNYRRASVDRIHQAVRALFLNQQFSPTSPPKPSSLRLERAAGQPIHV